VAGNSEYELISTTVTTAVLDFEIDIEYEI